MVSYISSWLSGFISLFRASDQSDRFNRDLQFIKTTIHENHPGIHNDFDPDFLSQMNKSCIIAEQLLNQACSDEEKIGVLKNFGKSFKDAHLWVQYDSIKSSQVADENKTGIFAIQQLSDDVTWITIPTFAPSKNQLDALQKIIRVLPQLRQGKVIFDLRGNGGGDSSWGTELLKAMFGEEYTNHCMVRKDQDVYVEWRASEGNLKHVEGFVPLLREQFPEEHPAIKWAETTYQGMKNAVEHGDRYYSEPKIPSNASLGANSINSFRGKVIAVVDRGCGSACLDFLDGLKTVQPDVILIGEPTGADSVYMELRTVQLPSGKGTFGFPIKVYRNRYRGHNVPHLPNVRYHGDLKDTFALQQFTLHM